MLEKTEEPVKSKIPAQLRGLFSEPPLLECEDPNLYWGFVEAVIDERKPETASDWIAVNDLVTKLWEERLLRTASNALVRAGTLMRVGSLLTAKEDKSGGVLRGQEELEQWRQKRAAAARRWIRNYKKNPKDRTPIASLLAQSGLTEAELCARVYQENSEALQMFERMIAARERGRRKLRKEDERLRRLQAKPKD